MKDFDNSTFISLIVVLAHLAVLVYGAAADVVENVFVSNQASA